MGQRGRGDEAEGEEGERVGGRGEEERGERIERERGVGEGKQERVTGRGKGQRGWVGEGKEGGKRAIYSPYSKSI